MSRFKCPHCGEMEFSRWDKYLAAKWKILVCPHCGKRSCSNPLVLALFYLAYLVDVIDLGYLAYFQNSLAYIAAMMVGWIILDLFSLRLPLSAMRSPPAGSVKTDDAELALGRKLDVKTS